jgi:short-subunit dehydrogenase
VTGAGSGLGRAIAHELANRCRLVLVDIDAVGLDATAAELRAAGATVEARAIDVTEPGAITDVIDAAAARDRVGYVFNNAGIGGTLAFDEATPAHWNRIIDLNLKAVIEGTTAAYRVMREQGAGRIVNTGSIAGLVPVPMQTLYNTTKFAVVGLSLSLRPEAARHGVQVSVVCPGNVATAVFGKPIIGAAAPNPIVPENAIPADDAARAIVAGVDANDPVIVFPERARELFDWFRHDPVQWNQWVDERVTDALGSSSAG